MKYPNIILYRHNKYSDIDVFVKDNNDKFDCTINITNDNKFLNNLYDPNYHVLVTFGDDSSEYNNNVYNSIGNKFCNKWIHVKSINEIDKFNYAVNYCYIHSVLNNKLTNRPVFSIYTTCYNSYNKIIRAMNSVLKQTFIDWEWIIIDDSPQGVDDHFKFLTDNLLDKRIRLYKRSKNSGNIGNVKNEAVMMCKGSFVLELDHDDEILPDVLAEANRAFTENPEVGFIYMDFINIYEDGTVFTYQQDESNSNLAKGYGDYYLQKYNNKWHYVFCTPNINNITMTCLTSLPNHPRIWRKDVLLSLGNYSEYLPICDDLELLLRTIINTKIIKIHKVGYVQYVDNNRNNFSLIRNSEINRIGPQYIVPIFFKLFDIDNKMKKLNAYDNPVYNRLFVKLWRRNPNYVYKYCNTVLQYNYDKQICILGFDSLIFNLDKIKTQYMNIRNDFIVLDNTMDIKKLCSKLDELNFDRMKCLTLNDVSYEEFTKYFRMVYNSCTNYEIIKSQN